MPLSTTGRAGAVTDAAGADPHTPILPAHIEATIQAIAELHRQHQRRATPSQIAVSQLTALVAKPRFVGALTLVLAAWVGANGLLQLAHRQVLDPAPFSIMQDVMGIAGVYITVLILITQRRENEMAETRDQLTLELAILNEQKSAKIIALLEEMRRDNPLLANRADSEAEMLSVPADPQAVLDAIRMTTEDAAAGGMEGVEGE